MAVSRNNVPHRPDAGYTLLMVVFLVATMLILVGAAVPNLLTQGRREREAEMVWRGEQYKRAIGLYYRAFGRFPTQIEDLTKLTNGMRFLRKAYTDPMNKKDGSWRLLYVGPNGQLIGSHRQMSVLQNLMSTVAVPGGPAQPQGSPGTAQGAAPGVAVSNGQQPPNPALAPNPLASQPQPLEGSVIGGNIIGVGSKIKEPSLRLYDGADVYDQWEFVWSAAPQIAIPGRQPAGPTPPPPAQQQPPAGQQQTAPGQNPVPGTDLPQVPQVPPVAN
jgi:type II secretory pathway pseudopilin PulG